MAIITKKIIFKNPWFIGIGSSVLGVFVIRLIDFLTGSKILLTVWNLIKFIIITILSFFNREFHLKLYALILIFLSGPLIGILLLWFISKIQDTKKESLPPWLQYKEDIFDGIIYKWNYEKSYNGKYIINDIRAYCPNCKCQIVYEKCPNCKSLFYGQIKPTYELEPLIIHRIEKMKYRK